MTTQANHKRNMREAEEEDAERGEVGVAGMARWQSIPATELTEDWKKVLFNQFHDLAAGSGIGVIYKDAQKDYDVVRWSTNEIAAGRWRRWLRRSTRKTQVELGIPIVVYNPLGWERSGE